MNIHISAAFLWGLATPFIAYGVIWIVCMILMWIAFHD